MSDDQPEKIFYIGTHADDDPERAALPFVMANAALAMDIQATVCLQGAGVYLAVKGYVDNMLKPGGFPPMNKLISDFLELGGRLMVCVPCIEARGIDESRDLVEGAQAGAAGTFNLEAMASNAVFVY
jgi:predicted peroxiredoxin